MNTPGIYIKETLSQPAVVGAVSTALPAFIGFTELAVSSPMLITNMLDYETHFGIGLKPNFTITLNPQNVIQDLVPTQRFFLYESIALYFRNGGGPCYIISAGIYSGITNAQNELETAFAHLQNLQDVTLVAVPDLHAEYKDSNQALAPLVSASGYAYLTSSLLNLMGQLQNKVAILDLHRPSATPLADSLAFRNAVNPILSEDLKYGVAYYPWVNTQAESTVSVDQLGLSTSFAGDPLVDQLATVTTDLQALEALFGFAPSMESLRARYETLKTTFLAATGAARRSDFSNVFIFLYDLVNAFSQLDGIAASIQSELTTLKGDAVLMENIQHLYRFKGILDSHTGPNYLNTTGFNNPANSDWFNLPLATTPYTTVSAIEADLTLLSLYETQVNGGGNAYSGWGSAGIVLEDLESGAYFRMDLLFAAMARIHGALLFKQQQAETQLLTQHPVYVAAVAAAKTYLQRLPCQGAIAGAYCTNDRKNGVWRSPANQSLQGVSGPLVMVTNAQQDGLNVDLNNGKSINALRTFTGKGTLIWGARTLASNSGEWRYVAVRRFYSFAEDAIKRAAEAFLFAPNHARTWVQVKGMITSFLVEQWNNGALQGTTLEEAFTVEVGVGPTAGEMDVTVGMAVTRPAEFISIRFSQSMQTV